MKLSQPFIITPRLMAGLQVGDAFISITYSAREGREGRTRYQFFIDLPGYEHSDDDLQSGCQGGNLQEGMSSLLTFLGGAAESYDYHQRTDRAGQNEDLFPPQVVAWASQHEDELSSLQSEIEEAEEPLIEE